jgi:iron complex outermembrane recepter protein
MRKLVTLLVLILLNQVSQSQEVPDTTKAVLQLREIKIRAYEQGRRLKDVPAAINYIGNNALERFSPSSIVSAINTMPGATME